MCVVKPQISLSATNGNDNNKNLGQNIERDIIEKNTLCLSGFFFFSYFGNFYMGDVFLLKLYN